MCDFKFNDGGRSKYFKGKDAGDCVTRAISIATGKDYKEVYNAMANGMMGIGEQRSARNGVKKKVYHKYLLENGFEWIPTMKIGQGCKVHLHKDELPSGVLIVRLSRHLSCVIDGVINDTYNPRRGSVVGMKNGVPFSQPELRCVYGYYKKIEL